MERVPPVRIIIPLSSELVWRSLCTTRHDIQQVRLLILLARHLQLLCLERVLQFLLEELLYHLLDLLLVDFFGPEHEDEEDEDEEGEDFVAAARGKELAIEQPVGRQVHNESSEEHLENQDDDDEVDEDDQPLADLVRNRVHLVKLLVEDLLFEVLLILRNNGLLSLFAAGEFLQEVGNEEEQQNRNESQNKRHGAHLLGHGLRHHEVLSNAIHVVLGVHGRHQCIWAQAEKECEHEMSAVVVEFLVLVESDSEANDGGKL